MYYEAYYWEKTDTGIGRDIHTAYVQKAGHPQRDKHQYGALIEVMEYTGPPGGPPVVIVHTTSIVNGKHNESWEALPYGDVSKLTREAVVAMDVITNMINEALEEP